MRSFFRRGQCARYLQLPVRLGGPETNHSHEVGAVTQITVLCDVAGKHCVRQIVFVVPMESSWMVVPGHVQMSELPEMKWQAGQKTRSKDRACSDVKLQPWELNRHRRLLRRCARASEIRVTLTKKWASRARPIRSVVSCAELFDRPRLRLLVGGHAGADVA